MSQVAVAELKEQLGAKNAEIAQVEKDAGLTTMAKISTAVSSAAAKVKPVTTKVISTVSATATTVSAKAQTLLGKKTDDGSASAGATDEPATDEPGTAGTDDGASEAAPIPAPAPNAPATTDAAGQQATDDAAEDAALRRKEAEEKVTVLRSEASEIATQIKNKESEISWLEKKTGAPRFPKTNQALATVKENASKGFTKAKLGTASLWQKAVTAGKSVSLSDGSFQENSSEPAA